MIIVLGWTLVAYAGGDPTAGKAVFSQCQGCHSLATGENGVGPSLHGLFGRRAGTVEAFRYSPALRDAAIVWDEETLGKYLLDPQALVPGTKKALAGLEDPQQRADLVAYLEDATR
jgi:cytochrome c